MGLEAGQGFNWCVEDTVHASASQAVGSETSTVLRVDDASELTVYVDVTAVGGGPGTLAIQVQTAGTEDASTWYTLQTLATFNSTGQKDPVTVTGFNRFVRLRSTVATNAVTWEGRISRRGH